LNTSRAGFTFSNGASFQEFKTIHKELYIVGWSFNSYFSKIFVELIRIGKWML
jgi:hypothetical protein